MGTWCVLVILIFVLVGGETSMEVGGECSQCLSILTITHFILVIDNNILFTDTLSENSVFLASAESPSSYVTSSGINMQHSSNDK